MDAALIPTPSQTVGPFFSLGLDLIAVADLTGPGVTGHPVTVVGTIRDGGGAPVTDAVIESWQADASGAYVAGPAVGTGEFRGFARVATDGAGGFELRTIIPGCVPGPDGTQQAPHLAVAIFMRGLLRQLITRVYFAHQTANDTDPILGLVGPERRHTLVAVPLAGSRDTFRWDVRLQGPDETVFFDI